MSQRLEFVRLAASGGVSLAALARRFGISRKTAYKWLARYRAAGPAGLQAQSRRPHVSPRRSPATTEQAVLAVRAAQPAWGGRKIRRVLQNHGHAEVPAASTITQILHRHDAIDPRASQVHHPWQRFEQPAPNALWQMDFKGHFALEQGRCHPLTVLDDHSRYCLGLQACANERTATVQTQLTGIFRCYGLPDRMLMDNGAPWGNDFAHPWTPLTVWLLRLGIAISHGRPFHPQTQGKEERFHATLQAELLAGRRFAQLAEVQAAFDPWRATYNHERPHEALGLAAPASRYRPSPQSFPETLPPLEYGPGDRIRTVQDGGRVCFAHQEFRVGKAFRGHHVALRPTTQDGLWQVYFSRQIIAQLDLRSGHSTHGRSLGCANVGRTGSAGSPKPLPEASFPSTGLPAVPGTKH